MPPLAQRDILAWVKSSNGWSFQIASIKKTFTLKNFKQALVFVNNVGDLAEKADHHPDILLHNWNQVTITLTTHSSGGLTIKDFNLAEQIESKRAM
jgi:4a-hydroxytetrahydrobiopterin dehydratase